MRFVEREGLRILQQVWIKQVLSSDDGWINGGEHRWRDVPLMSELVIDDGKYWVKAC